MIKKCKWCQKEKEMKGKKLYCTPKCKKAYENSQRNGGCNRSGKNTQSHSLPPSDLNCPEYLNELATEYWNKVAPTVVARGHLNVLSEDAFAELCDLYSRLRDVNKAIDETNRSLLQIDDKWDNKTGVETQSFKESALSDIKRKYSKLFLDYRKQFYMDPKENRGNFGIQEDEKDPLDEFIKGQNGK
jgi:phage terminase small subunit